MATALIFGEQEDIQLKLGDYIDHTWTITDSNGDAYTFPDGVSTVDVKIYDYKGGTQVGSTVDIAGGELSRSDNVITWASTWASWDASSVALHGDFFYYEMTLVTTTSSKHLTMAYGTLEVI